MKNSLKFTVVGGDMRQVRLCELLSANGHEVYIYALERQNFEKDVITHTCACFDDAFSNSDCIILPLPLLKEADKLNAPLSNAPCFIDDILKAIPANIITVAGSVPEHIKAIAQNYGIDLIDYLKREELAILNAIPTAEGAIQIAMEESAITIHGSNCLVIGNGRVGKVLARLLSSLSAKVTVSARKHTDFADIYSNGYEKEDTRSLDGKLFKYDFIFNTVPKEVLDKNRLRDLKKDALVIDLASKPGGIDFVKAQELGIRVIWALSLPGKVAPVTSAKTIMDTVFNILSEKGYDI